MDSSSMTTTLGTKSIFRPFPVPLTGRQWFYLTFLQGVGAGFIDGGANFGIAYASMSTFASLLIRKQADIDSVPRPKRCKDVGV
jgi:hypothetical protein